MRMLGYGALLALVIVGGFSAAPVAAEDYIDRQATVNKIQRDAARGGPQPEGAVSPFMTRIKVCKQLPTEIIDRSTGVKRTALRKVCWFE